MRNINLPNVATCWWKMTKAKYEHSNLVHRTGALGHFLKVLTRTTQVDINGVTN